MPGTRIGNNVKIQNNVSIYEGVTLEDDVFCGPSCVFTNVINPRSHVPRRGEFQAWRSHISDRAQEVRAEHERRMGELAGLLSVSRERLRELASLAALPVTGCHRKIVRSVFLHGIGAMVAAFALILGLGISELLRAAARSAEASACARSPVCSAARARL
jgi:hypothetical protein